MHNIDFLPTDYHRQAADHRLRLWAAALLTVYGGLLAAVSGYQHVARQRLQQRYELVRAPYERVQQANRRLAELQSQLTEANDVAELYTYLRHPWPRTQILSALIGSLPPEVRLTDVTIRREQPETLDRRPDAGRRSAGAQTNAESSQKPPGPRQMLEQLRRDVDATHTVVHAQGVTTDTSALHRCIAALDQSRLFTRVNLDSLDSREDDAAPVAFTFEVSLDLLPGYGQPGGPGKPEAKQVASLP